MLTLLQRGTKRKSSPLQSKPEDENPAKSAETSSSVKAEPSTAQAGSGRVAKGVVLSDDEDEDDIPKRQSRNKASLKARTSDDDLRALMEVDDCALDFVLPL